MAVIGVDERVSEAYRTAGRAVASALRGWTDGLVAPGRQLHWSEAPDSAGPFIAYAGVWAAARRRGDLAGEDGVSPTRLTEAMCAHPGDASTLGAAQFEVATVLRRTGSTDEWGWLPGVGAAWQAELEQMWPVVQHVAVLLLAGREVSAARVRRLADDRLVGGLAI